MPEIDHVSKIVARKSGRALASIVGLSCRTWKPSESTLQATTERLADRAFIASEGKERFVVYFEFVSKWDSSVPWSILAKSGMLAERERLPVASLIFILRRGGYSPQNGTLRLTIRSNPAQQVWFYEKPLWEIKPEPWWEREPGLMALYPLCQHTERPEESVLHAAKRIEENERDGAVRADLLTSLGIFGQLAFPRLDALSLIGREKMKESKAYRGILDEGLEKGREDERRRALLDLIESRFGKSAVAPFKPVLKSVHSLAKLRSLSKLAATCSDLDNLMAAAK